MNNTVYIITGPTASGKSLIAYYLAKRTSGEIINCDSIQLYKNMDIGSAKPSETEMRKVPHHLYSIVAPDEEMSAAKYQQMALASIDDILSRGKIPIVCGGTGLYLNSIIYDMEFGAESENSSRREELEKLADERGSLYMHQYLEALDHEAASRIHPNNLRKVIRAIEAFEGGRGIGKFEDLKLNSKYDFKFYILNMDRAWLYERINKRVDDLIKKGLVKEVSHLISMGYSHDLPSMQGIGYKELYACMYGECSLDQAIEEIKKNTRHYAKRQLTWLKRYDFAHWVEIKKGDNAGDIIDRILYYKPENM